MQLGLTIDGRETYSEYDGNASEHGFRRQAWLENNGQEQGKPMTVLGVLHRSPRLGRR